MQVDKKIDHCPFCGNIIMRRRGKCPNCRKMIEELFFEPIYCPHCNQKSQIVKGQCSLCSGKINIPEFEYGKYIEIPKKRRLNLVSDREEKIYEKLKLLHFGKDSSETDRLIETQGQRNKKWYKTILVVSLCVQAVFIILALVTKIFVSSEPMPAYQLEPKEFFMPIFLWIIGKTVFYAGFYVFSFKKPIYAYFLTIMFLLLTFLFEILTFPATPLLYSLSGVFSLLLLIYGVKIALEYEDYINHFI